MWSAGRGRGHGGLYQRLIISCVKITEEQVCQNRRTGPFPDHGGINPEQMGSLHATLLHANKCHQSEGVALPLRSLMTSPFGLVVVGVCHREADGTLSLSQSLSPCLVVLKLNDWKPPASAEESMTSTPYSLWFFLYSMTATTRIATAMMPAPRPEYRATSLEPSMPEAHKTHGRGTLRSAADKSRGEETMKVQIQYSYTQNSTHPEGFSFHIKSLPIN